MDRLDVIIDTLYGRHSRVRVDPRREVVYRGWVAKLWSQYTYHSDIGALPPPEVVLVKTPFAKPQSLSFEGHEYLVYDQHLGRVLTQLTDICMGSGDEYDTWVEFDRILSERYLLRGDLRSAAMFALESALFSERLKETRSPPEPYADLTTSVAVQESSRLHMSLHTLFIASHPSSVHKRDVARI